MVDVHTPEIRSKNMRAIHSADTKPELLIRKALHAAGFRFRLHKAELPGKPDVVLAKYRTVIFVHGCFWHGHDCKYFKLPKSHPDFWAAKIEANRARDQVVLAKLNQLGWHVIVVWECATRPSGPGLPEVIRRISVCLTEGNCITAPTLTVISA